VSHTGLSHSSRFQVLIANHSFALLELHDGSNGLSTPHRRPVQSGSRDSPRSPKDRINTDGIRRQTYHVQVRNCPLFLKDTDQVSSHMQLVQARYFVLDEERRITFDSLVSPATLGNVNSSRPGLLDMLGRAKWCAFVLLFPDQRNPTL